MLITHRLEEVATALGARSARAAWTDFFYQLANRIAHLHFLRRHGAPAWLVLVNFINDEEMGGPTSPEGWRTAYEVAFHVMGLGTRHPLSRFILEVFPDVKLGRAAAESPSTAAATAIHALGKKTKGMTATEIIEARDEGRR